MSDVKKHTPVSASYTMFRPGSISKLFTWTAVMQLVEEGKVDLDADVNKYIDFHIAGFGGKPITVRHLMTHTPGFEEGLKDLLIKDPKAMISLETAMKANTPETIYPPGAVPAYSNYGAGLAGYIVQRVSGMPFEAYVEQKIFTPLQMRRVDIPPARAGSAATAAVAGVYRSVQRCRHVRVLPGVACGRAVDHGAGHGQLHAGASERRLSCRRSENAAASSSLRRLRRCTPRPTTRQKGSMRWRSGSTSRTATGSAPSRTAAT